MFVQDVRYGLRMLVISRCVERIEGFRRLGRTLLVVSHDLGLVRRLCSRAIQLRHGRVVRDGPAGPVIDAYLREWTSPEARVRPVARSLA